MTGYQPRDESPSTSESKSYDRLFSRVVVASLYTGVQLWALMAILTTVHVDGVLGVALPVLAGGASAGVFLIWREVRAVARHLRHTVIDRRNEPIRHHRPDRHLIAV
jgi:hypothetical protein